MSACVAFFVTEVEARRPVGAMMDTPSSKSWFVHFPQVLPPAVSGDTGFLGEELVGVGISV